MTKPISIVQVNRCTLEGGTKGNPKAPLVLRFGVETPAHTGSHSWGGDLAFTRLALEGFANWLRNQEDAHRRKVRLHGFSFRGLLLEPRVLTYPSKSQLILTLPTQQLATLKGAVQRGEVALWPLWRLPFAEVQGVVRTLLGATPPPTLPHDA